MQNIKPKAVVASRDHRYSLQEFKTLRLRKRDLAVFTYGDKFLFVSAHTLQLVLKNFGITGSYYATDDLSDYHVVLESLGGDFTLYSQVIIATGINEQGDEFAKWKSLFDRDSDGQPREVHGRLIYVGLE